MSATLSETERTEDSEHAALTTAAWDMEAVPALAGLSAFSALVALGVDRVFVASMSNRAQHAFWLQVERWGDFATNLATIAGAFALATGLLSFVLRADRVTLHRRLVISGFSAIFLSITVLSTVLDRERTTTQLVLFAVGAANVLGATVAATAGRYSSGILLRSLALLTGLLALGTLVSQVLQLMTQLRLSVWQLQAYELLRGGGEILYLLLLLLASVLAIQQRPTLRDRLSRSVGTALLGGFAATFYLAAVAMQGDFGLVLYHAQRVTLFLDGSVAVYALPMSAALALGLAAQLGSDRRRSQIGLGLLLLLAAGYAPREPGRLVSMTLGMVLMSRAVMGEAVRRLSAR